MGGKMSARPRITVNLLFLLVAMLAATALAGDSRNSENYGYENHSFLLVPALPDDLIDDFQAGYFDVARILPDGSMQVVATSRDREILLTRFGARVEIENMEEFYRSRLDATKDMGGYHTYDETVAELMALKAAHTSIMRYDTIGYTYEGRVIFAVKISDNVEVEEDEPEVQFNGLVHAREPMGLEICLATINYLLDNQADPEIADMINNTQIWFVPIMNPDGYVYNELTNPLGGGMWRKNRRDNGDGSFGIDLNRNWGFMWAAYPNSSPVPSSIVYHGAGPFSEPETAVMRDFINAHKFVSIVNYHSFGLWHLIPHGVADILGCADNPIYETYVNLYANLTGYIYSDIGMMTGFGGDATCWQYAEQLVRPKTFAFLVETANSFWPDMEEMADHRQRNHEINLQLIKDVQEMYNQPSFWLGTDLTHFDSTISDCSENFTETFTFLNHHETMPISVSMSFANLTPAISWCTPTTFNGILNPGESVEVSFDFTPSNMFGLPDATMAQGALQLVIIAQDGSGTINMLDYQLMMRYAADYDDGDSYMACLDNCPLIANEDQADMDVDGVGDICDNCIDVANTDQYDEDFDGNGDACDLCPGFDDYDDYDEDNVPDSCDNCPVTANAGQDETDGDGVGDLCDVCPGFDDLADDDADGVPDGCDVCPGFDDLADNDVDGVPDDCDNCPDTPNPNQVDTDEDGIGDACEVVCGDTNRDGQANVGDAVYMIAYVFKGGPAPDPVCSGDANGDGQPNVGDAVYLIAYVFNGGPPPVITCCATE
jgi:hypothetical protein